MLQTLLVLIRCFVSIDYIEQKKMQYPFYIIFIISLIYFFCKIKSPPEDPIHLYIFKIHIDIYLFNIYNPESKDPVERALYITGWCTCLLTAIFLSNIRWLKLKEGDIISEIKYINNIKILDNFINLMFLLLILIVIMVIIPYTSVREDTIEAFKFFFKNFDIISGLQALDQLLYSLYLLSVINIWIIFIAASSGVVIILINNQINPTQKLSDRKLDYTIQILNI